MSVTLLTFIGMDPWTVLPPHITVRHHRLHTHAAVTDGHSTIWIDDRLSDTERRCALMHELVHLEHGHAGHQPETVERAVRAETARLLIPSDRLWAHRHWHDTMHALAEELGVTTSVLRDRLENAGPEETKAIQRARWEAHLDI
ncbi:ImmA/IrrE family metallo-endopeptidase [Kocuria rosea]|uniref:ImmA/IrrE family metallo-endopeptidase n=2 Tax=Kocuria TaxID=57493 RepID=UPI003D32BFD7